MITPFVAFVSILGSAPEGQWGATTLRPAELAAKIDARLATLAGAKLQYHFTYFKEPAVGHGYADCEATVVSPGVFWIQVPQIDPNRREWMQREIWISDGKRFGRSVTADRPGPGPMSSRPALPKRPAQAWFANFSTVIFSGLGRPTHPIAALVADATRSGYAVKTDVRKVTYEGRPIVSYRLVLSRGPARYEMVVDGKGFLPVGVTNTIGPTDNVRWSAVRWNLKPGKTLNPKDTTFRKQAPTTIYAPKPRRP